MLRKLFFKYTLLFMGPICSVEMDVCPFIINGRRLSFTDAARIQNSGSRGGGGGTGDQDSPGKSQIGYRLP